MWINRAKPVPHVHAQAYAPRSPLQARFYAPENRQKFIQQTAADRPIIELPDND